jgi:DNA-binding CsgD family transcriptional regulator
MLGPPATYLSGVHREELLERAQHLAALGEVLRAAFAGPQGGLVLVSGEAGVGKTSLVRAFCAEQEGSHRVLWGSCDALFTPRPLGPFLDVAADAGGELARVVAGDPRPHEVAAALGAELRHAPSVLVLEDLHWADEATLDVVSLVARRLEHVPVLVVATYRDDELAPTHPLRIVLGELSTTKPVTRLKLGSLSAGAVAQLAAATTTDSEDLYRRTGGNAFFVTEVLAGGADHVPPTVRDAVLARAARLGAAARAALDAAAIVPRGCEYWLLDALVPTAPDDLEACLSSGMLVAGPDKASFRHELARLAIEEALSPARRVRLHMLTLQALESAASADPARLAHHAEAAGDAPAVLRFAPEAGRRAAAVGAHREAADQFARALRFADQATDEVRGDLSDRRAYACYLSGDFPAAVTAQREALEQHRRTSNLLRVGHAARSLSLVLRYEGDVVESWELGHQAVTELERLPEPSRELAMAYCNVSHLAAAREDGEGTRSWATKAAAVAEKVDDEEAQVYAALNVASIDLLADYPTASDTIDRLLRTAVEHGLEEQAGRAYVALTWWASRGRRYQDAQRYVDPGLRYCDERGLDLWRSYLIAYQARAHLDGGRWGEAVTAANLIIGNPRTSPLPRIVALAVVGLARARRDDPDAFEPLEEAWTLARDTGELQRIEPIAAARAEALWLAGRANEVEAATAPALALALAHGSGWVAGEMLALRQRAGIAVAAPADLAAPFACELAGDWAQAAAAWRALDSPYEAALALTEADDDESVRRGYTELLELGARAAAAIVARRLRDRGAPQLPRGPRPATRRNPAGLTARELDVLALVARGLPTRDIASALVVSPRTVDHHVAAILRKLGVQNRRAAAREAIRLGLAAQD